MLQESSVVSSSSTLESAVNRANGRRRCRLLSVREIENAAARLLPGEHAFLHGGHVANCYGFSAVATIAAVWKTGSGESFAIVKVGNAHKGCTGFGRCSSFVPPINARNAVQL